MFSFLTEFQSLLIHKYLKMKKLFWSYPYLDEQFPTDLVDLEVFWEESDWNDMMRSIPWHLIIVSARIFLIKSYHRAEFPKVLD